MKKYYRNIEWINFRNEVIELDGNACCRCGRTDNEVTLQVHHKEYFKGRKPWEYKYEYCETLCKGCHAREHGIILPNHGWDYICDEDLGDLCGICELCNTEIRYAFHVAHKHWEPMVVGTQCCDNLTGTEEASNFRKYTNALKRFYNSSRWKIKNNIHEITQKKNKIEIYKERENYKLKINDKIGKNIYLTLEDAKKRAFDFIYSGEADVYFKRKPNKTS